MLCVLSCFIIFWVERVDLFTDCSKAVLLLLIVFVIMFHVCLYYTILSVPCSLVITCWERAGLLALLCDVSLCLCHFQIRCSGSGVVLDCIDSSPLPSLLLFIGFLLFIHVSLFIYIPVSFPLRAIGWPVV